MGGNLAEVLGRQCGVLSAAQAAALMSPATLRWQLSSGRWQRPWRGAVVTHSGPLSNGQVLWAALLACGPGAVLAGLTAATLDGLTGFDDPRIFVLVPAARRLRVPPPGVVVRRSRLLGPPDVHPARLPPRTRVARAVLDAAAWMRSDDGARAVVAAAVQQRLVRPGDLLAALERYGRFRRRGLVRATLADVAGGAQALSELDFCRLTRRYGIPEPDRQAVRLDSAGRRRWLDALWEEARLIAEADGRWHMDAAAWWADMRRDNDFTAAGYRVLRFPAFALREQPEIVAGQIKAALGQADFSRGARR